MFANRLFCKRQAPLNALSECILNLRHGIFFLPFTLLPCPNFHALHMLCTRYDWEFQKNWSCYALLHINCYKSPSKTVKSPIARFSAAFMPDCMTFNLAVFSPNNELKNIALDRIFKHFKKSIMIESFKLLTVSISTPIFPGFFRFRITPDLKPQGLAICLHL